MALKGVQGIDLELAGGGGGDTTTANNGLTETADNIQLGGTLIQNTTISNGVFNFEMASTTGDIYLGTGVFNNYAYMNIGPVGLPGYSASEAVFLESRNTATIGRSVLNLTPEGIEFWRNLPGDNVNNYISKVPQYQGFLAGSVTVNGTTYDADLNGNVDIGTLGATITADNGLTKTLDNIQLGGTLLQNTTITHAGFTLSHTGTLTGFSQGIANYTNTNGGIAIKGNSSTGSGVWGSTATGPGAVVGIASSSGYGTYGQSNTGIGAYGQSASGLAGMFISTGGPASLKTENRPASTNTVETVAIIARSTTSTPANNIGGAIDFNLANSLNSLTLSNRIISKFTSITSAAETSEFSITGVNTGTVNTLVTLSGSGAAKLDKYGIGTFTGTPTYSLNVDASGNVIESTLGGGGAYIPLAGTTVGNEVTGPIEFAGVVAVDAEYNLFSTYSTAQSEIAFDSDGEGVRLVTRGTSGLYVDYRSYANVGATGITLESVNTNTGYTTGFQVNGINKRINLSTSDNTSKGLDANFYYGANYTDNTYVQKKYVDDKVGSYIPLAGTLPGSVIEGTMTVTNGGVEFITEGTGGYFRFSDDTIFTRVVQGGLETSIKVSIDGIVITDEFMEMGLTGASYYGSNYVNESFVQKQYVDDKIPYKVYTALVTQTGTSDPVATVLQNTLGEIPVLGRNSLGWYDLVTIGSIFTANKTFLLATVNMDSSGAERRLVNIARQSSTVIEFTTNQNNLLSDNFSLSIEIRVYP